MTTLQSLKARARALKLELIAVALAARHPRTPWYARLLVAGCVAYALTPADVLADCRRRSVEVDAKLPRLGRFSWTVILAAWASAVALIAWWTVA